MWITFALLILAATLFVIFSDEVVNLIKNFWKKPWFKLLAPLCIASYVLIEFEPFFMHLFNQLKLIWFSSVNTLMIALPETDWVVMSVEIFMMLLFSLAPVIAVDRWILFRHKTKRLTNRFYVAMIIWLVIAFIFVSGAQFN